MGLPAKRLVRTFSTDAKVGGVCGGIGKFTGWNANIFRVTWIVGALFTGVIPAVLAYIAAWIFIPEEPRQWDK